VPDIRSIQFAAISILRDCTSGTECAVERASLKSIQGFNGMAEEEVEGLPSSDPLPRVEQRNSLKPAAPAPVDLVDELQPGSPRPGVMLVAAFSHPLQVSAAAPPDLEPPPPPPPHSPSSSRHSPQQPQSPSSARSSVPVPFRVRSAPALLRSASKQDESPEAAAIRETILRRASAATSRETVYKRRPLNGVPVQFVVCPCGQRNSSSDFFCSACQKSLASIRKEALAVCKNCGRRNSPSTPRCIQCKDELLSPRVLNRVLDAQQPELDQVPIECNLCGHPNSKLDTRCKQCSGVLPHRRPGKPCCPVM